MIISFLLLLIELLYETRYGDKHDRRSTVILLCFITIAAITSNILMYAALRIVLFDYLFNIGWGRKWYYLGNTATWDKKLKKVNRYLLLAIKLIIGAGLIYLHFNIMSILFPPKSPKVISNNMYTKINVEYTGEMAR